jgi:hypothetical protein
VILAIGLLNLINRTQDGKYFELVLALARQLSNNQQLSKDPDKYKNYAADPDVFVDMVKKGDLEINLPPVAPEDINGNMAKHFLAEEAAMKSL